MTEEKTAIERRWEESFCPVTRSERPLTGASRYGDATDEEGLAALDTVDRMATASEARTETAVGDELLALLEPPEVLVDQEAMRVLIVDRGEPVGYELWFRPGRGQAGGPGWLELAREPGGGIATRAVSACEVMALAREADLAGAVADMTLRLARVFEATDTAGGAAIAWRLRAEVLAGRGGERVSLRAIQARILQALAEGETLASLCRRGGFVDRSGRPDTSWLERRAGLAPLRCNRTGKWRRARTASPALVARMARALGLAPAEVGV